MADDFFGHGGTLVNLRGWIEHQGGRVVGAVALTGKPYSAKLNPSRGQLHELREKHGPDFEKWWQKRFGHFFDCLTQSEARYLARPPDADAIRNRLAAAEQKGNGEKGRRSTCRTGQGVKIGEVRASFANGQTERDTKYLSVVNCNQVNNMSDTSWIEAVECWRSLSPEEKRRRHLEAIPRHVANSMAMEGEPVDEEWIRERLAEYIRQSVTPERPVES